MGGEAGRGGEREEGAGGYLERAGPGAVVMDDRDLICVRVLICDAVRFGDLDDFEKTRRAQRRARWQKPEWNKLPRSAGASPQYYNTAALQ